MSEVSRLPVAAMSVWEWQYSGACRCADPRLFFHPEHERGPARRRRDEQAVAICQSCPVIERCRRHAIEVQEPFGVWGGLTERSRDLTRRNELAERRVDVDGPDPLPMPDTHDSVPGVPLCAAETLSRPERVTPSAAELQEQVAPSWARR